MMNNHGEPKPVYHAKRLCAQYIRPGDWIWFPRSEQDHSGVDVVATRDDNGRVSALLVHQKEDVALYPVAAFDHRLSDCNVLFKIDEGTGNQVSESMCDGVVRFNGYGVAVVTNRVAIVNDLGQLVGHEGL
jgi:hypothetical protein